MAETSVVHLSRVGDENSVSSESTSFGGLVFTTQVASLPDGSIELGELAVQADQTLRNVRDALERAGSSLADVLHMTVYLTEIENRKEFNEVYERLFTRPFPVRAAVGVKSLARPGMQVEVTVIAAKST